jgi:hypothetical protein
VSLAGASPRQAPCADGRCPRRWPAHSRDTPSRTSNRHSGERLAGREVSAQAFKRVAALRATGEVPHGPSLAPRVPRCQVAGRAMGRRTLPRPSASSGSSSRRSGAARGSERRRTSSGTIALRTRRRAAHAEISSSGRGPSRLRKERSASTRATCTRVRASSSRDRRSRARADGAALAPASSRTCAREEPRVGAAVHVCGCGRACAWPRTSTCGHAGWAGAGEQLST